MVVLDIFWAIGAVVLANSATAERVLGVYIFQRHGDRTPKVLAPTKLTGLGYTQEYMTGTFFRDRYISPASQKQIEGISTDIVDLSQVHASAPEDEVIANSGQAWLQGLYPPVGALARETLRNGSTIEAPFNGYQLIPMSSVDMGSNSESSPWLQGTTNCKNAQISSNRYFSSSHYRDLLSATRRLYQSLEPILNQTFSVSELNYKNAFTIWDLINVAMIHNSTDSFPPSNLLSGQTMKELHFLANAHEFNLAYNSSEMVRAVAGMALAGEVVTFFNRTISSEGHKKLNVQFGAYSTFLSYFGLMGLADYDANFTGIPDYSSSMAWELVTNTSGSGIPPEAEISVRFLFHNGTSIQNSTDLHPYPLFGQPAIELPWLQFVANTKKIAILSQSQWCNACGNITGICASGDLAPASPPRGMSLGVAGVIGALVTLGVLAVMATFAGLLIHLRLVRKRASAGRDSVSEYGHTSITKTGLS